MKDEVDKILEGVDIPSRIDPYQPVHAWFELTYSSYLILQRSIMESMSIDWQKRMVKLLHEVEDTVDTTEIPGKFWVRARGKGNRFIEDPYSNYRHPPEIPGSHWAWIRGQVRNPGCPPLTIDCPHSMVTPSSRCLLPVAESGCQVQHIRSRNN